MILFLEIDSVLHPVNRARGVFSQEILLGEVLRGYPINMGYSKATKCVTVPIYGSMGICTNHLTIGLDSAGWCAIRVAT
jgi:hypothetical protein